MNIQLHPSAAEATTTSCCDSTTNEVSSLCCGPAGIDKTIDVDFLYLDLNTCERCGDTEATLDEAVAEVSTVLKTLGFTLNVNKVEMATLELAEQYKFESSPTIRINGRDISDNVQENTCKDCGDLCGTDVDCRVFEYEGGEFNAPPKAMIVEALLGATNPQPLRESKPYTMPENLKIFFEGKSAKSCCDMEIVEETESACCSCCSPADESKDEKDKRDIEK